ncbi:MAG: intradiol ring-cleavage dioxygenase, partial [Geminicoccaceae bacterium]
REFNEHNATEAVIARLADCRDPRLKQVMSSIVKHLHAVAREVEPTFEEWMMAIRFLTETGQICDETRQEFILLSDTLGLSMLVDAINHRNASGVTESTVLGPFHVEGAAALEHGADICKDGKGEPTVVIGRVLDPAGRPIAGALLDVWQTNALGLYDVQQPGVQPAMNLRGKFQSDADGGFWFKTVKPASYPIPTDGPVGRLLASLGRHPYRPAHIHFIVTADGFLGVTTHLFVDGDPYLGSDAVFGVKESLVVPFVRQESPSQAEAYGVRAPFYTVRHDFRLEPARAAAADGPWSAGG